MGREPSNQPQSQANPEVLSSDLREDWQRAAFRRAGAMINVRMRLNHTFPDSGLSTRG